MRAGGILVYPTETYYALGCMANVPEAVQTIFKIKNRAPEKALPLLAASIGQASEIADLSALPPDFIRHFWPGPLTIVVPGKNVAPGLMNNQGKVAIRVSSSPIARGLAESANFALAATSANLAGRPAPAHWPDLDATLLNALAKCDLPAGLLRGEGAGSPLPSTIVEPVHAGSGHIALKIHRQGMVAPKELKAWLPLLP